MPARPCLLYHALGGGLGHGMRALALARQLSRRLGGRHVLVVNTPFAPALAAAARAEAGLELLATAGGREEIVEFLTRRIALLHPDLWVIDTFPRGVVGELVPLLEGWSGCPRVLIARPLKPEYVRACRIEEWVRRHYDLVLLPGEPGPLAGLPRAELFPPFLVRDRHELPSRQEALALVEADEPIVLIAGSGNEDECRDWRDEASRLATHWPSAAPPLRLALPLDGVEPHGTIPLLRHCPLLECLPAVRLLVGSAGYHLVHEARFVGVAGLFQPRQRQYDDQAARLRSGEVLHGDLAARVIERLGQPPPASEDGANGASLAAGRIAELFFSGTAPATSCPGSTASPSACR